MDERDVADRVEAQQVVLRQALLGQCARPTARQDGRGCGDGLEKIAPREHVHARRSALSAANAGARIAALT